MEKTMILFGSVLLGATAFAAENASIGPLLPQPAAAIYIVADGKPVSATASITAGSAKGGERLMLRAFDPEENVSFWKYVELGKPNLQVQGDMELNGISQLPPADASKPGDELLSQELPISGKGVNQIRVVAGALNSSCEIKLSRPLPYGVSFQNGDFSAWKGQPKTMYAFVPPHAEELFVKGGPVVVKDENGAVLLDNSVPAPEAKRIAVSKTGAVWSFEFPNLESWKLRAWGFPLILCPDKEAAKEIKASVEVLPDGTVVCHKFQRKIAELLPKLLSPENAGKTEDLIVPLSTKREEWLKTPERNSIIAAGFTGVAKAIREQNVDPASHWGGAAGGGDEEKGRKSWDDFEKLPPPQNRWDRLTDIPGLWAGASGRDGGGIMLAIAAGLDSPLNPYYGRKEIVNRAAAAALRDLMALGEDEMWRGIGSSADPYPGNTAFALGQKSFPPYALVAPLLPKETRDVWTEGLRHLADRMYPVGLVSCRNQSSHYLVVFEEFAKGSGDKSYEKLARDYAKRFIDGLNPAGFAIEEQGPDMTYNGMSHWHMAVYARMSNDPAMIEALRKSYFFFNHTVAPEPDGKTILGASNMGHRTGGSFAHEQWSGAKTMMDALLPEVAVWDKDADPKETQERCVKNIEKCLAAKDSLKNYLGLDRPRYEFWSEPVEKAQWPALSESSFTRNIGNELIAFKRPGYYACVYVGHPAPNKHYVRGGREKFGGPIDEAYECKGGKGEKYKAAPFVGGGLSMFWTKPFGSAVLAMNWAPTTHNGIIATKEDGTRWWEDYFAGKFALDEKSSTLKVSGRIEGLPLSYVRTYKALDDKLDVSLELKAEKAVSLKSLVENFPIPVGSVKRDGMEIRVQGEKDGAAKASKIELLDKKGAGVVIDFGKPCELTVQRNGPQYQSSYEGTEQTGRVELRLPSKLEAGQTVTLNYSLAGKQ